MTTSHGAAWHAALHRLPLAPPTHGPEYARVFEANGDGTAECLVYEADGHLALFPYIRRPLDRLPFAGPADGALCDIVTPYGYGGPLHTAGDDPAAAGVLLAGLRRALADHARATGIVCEFTRFMPWLDNHRGLEETYDAMVLQERNVTVDLNRSDAALFADCRATTRRYARRARDAGIVIERPDPAAGRDVFTHLYRHTMERHGQTGYLNFDHAFFDALFAAVPDDLVLFVARDGDRIVAAALFLRVGDVLDYMLGGSETAALPRHPNHLLFVEALFWARAAGFRQLHLGGGRPSLLYFKRGLSHRTLDYHLGRHVFLPEVYADLSARRDAWSGPEKPWTPDYFPRYRRGLGW